MNLLVNNPTLACEWFICMLVISVLLLIISDGIWFLCVDVYYINSVGFWVVCCSLKLFILLDHPYWLQRNICFPLNIYVHLYMHIHTYWTGKMFQWTWAFVHEHEGSSLDPITHINEEPALLEVKKEGLLELFGCQTNYWSSEKHFFKGISLRVIGQGFCEYRHTGYTNIYLKHN